jgi:hypothetical protein
MPEKSPQKRSAKKAGRSLKEKRADKKAKADDPAPMGFKASQQKAKDS